MRDQFRFVNSMAPMTSHMRCNNKIEQAVDFEPKLTPKLKAMLMERQISLREK